MHTAIARLELALRIAALREAARNEALSTLTRGKS